MAQYDIGWPAYRQSMHLLGVTPHFNVQISSPPMNNKKAKNKFRFANQTSETHRDIKIRMHIYHYHISFWNFPLMDLYRANRTLLYTSSKFVNIQKQDQLFTHTYYRPPIIIMQFRSHHPQQNMPDSVSQPQPYNSPPRTPHHPSSQQGDNSSSANIVDYEKVAIICKKQFKSYCQLSGKIHGGKCPQNIKNHLILALRLLGCHELQQKSVQDIFNTNNKIFPICSQKMKSKRKRSVALFLSNSIEILPKKQLFFTLSIIDTTGKIIQNRLIRKWQQIEKQRSFLKRKYNVAVEFVQNKESFLSNLPKKQLLIHELLENYQDFEAFLASSQHQIARESLPVQQQIQQNPPFLESFREFASVVNYIQKELIHYVLKQQKQDPQKFIPVLALAHNLVLPLISSTQTPLRPQLQQFLPTMKASMQYFTEHGKTDGPKVDRYDHFPQKLTNAQECYICRNRDYVVCPACSNNTQGRNIALCLNCYKNHHQRICNNKEISYTAELYEKWHVTDLLVQSWLPTQQIPSIEKVEQVAVKKEEQE